MRLHRLRDVPVSIKVFLAPGLTLCALLLLAVVAFIQLQDGKRRVHDLSEGAFETFRLTAAAKNAASELQVRLLDAILVSATEVDKGRVTPRIALVEQASQRAHFHFDALANWLGVAAPTAKKLRDQLNNYLDSVSEVLHIARDDPASAWIIVNEVRRGFAQLEDELEQFQSNANELRQTASRQAITDARLAGSVFLWLVILTVAFSKAVTLIAARSITRPIARLTHAMSDLAAGKLDTSVPELDRADEMGSIAAAMQVFKDGLKQAAQLNAEREVARARELRRFRQLADATFEGIVIHQRGRILEVNAALCELLGYPDPAALRGAHVLRFVPRAARAQVRRMLYQSPKETSELDIVHADGAKLPVEVLSRPFQYDQEEVVLTALRDLSERKKAEAQIRRLAFHDALTGLPNRYLLNDRLSQALEMAARTGNQVAVLCLDLDRFKFVNDLFGHDCGDQVLKEVASRLSAAVRECDTVTRLGGDEFAIVQVLVKEQRQRAVLAERVTESLSAPYRIGDQPVEIGVSIGIACSPDHGKTVTTLLKNGDIALYRAKASGRHQFRFFEAEMDVQLRERRSLEHDLRQAVLRRDFILHYQPLYGCSQRNLEGFEALLRWSHPVRGAVSPEDFIPVAEECGLIMQLGYWVLETACLEAVT